MLPDKMRHLIVTIAAASAMVPMRKGTPIEPADVTPLAQAHAHNDYEHKRPLFDALDHGFCSIEADVWLVDGELLVGHDRKDLKPERTLESLYLRPLAERAAQRGGWIYQPNQTVTLLVDLKNEGAAAYRALHEKLRLHRQLFQATKDGQPPPVMAIVSGDRPIDLIVADRERQCGFDGRIADLDSELPTAVMPLISDNWRLHFRWNGNGPIPPAELEKLRSFVDRTHARGRRLRFWATPESESLWAELVDGGVDLIGTDDLARLQEFFSSREGRNSPP